MKEVYFTAWPFSKHQVLHWPVARAFRLRKSDSRKINIKKAQRRTCSVPLEEDDERSDETQAMKRAGFREKK